MLRNMSDGPVSLRWASTQVTVPPGMAVDMAVFGMKSEHEKKVLEGRFLAKWGATFVREAPAPVVPEKKTVFTKPEPRKKGKK